MASEESNDKKLKLIEASVLDKILQLETKSRQNYDQLSKAISMLSSTLDSYLKEFRIARHSINEMGQKITELSDIYNQVHLLNVKINTLEYKYKLMN